MEATVAERGQITLPKAVRDALGDDAEFQIRQTEIEVPVAQIAAGDGGVALGHLVGLRVPITGPCGVEAEDLGAVGVALVGAHGRSLALLDDDPSSCGVVQPAIGSAPPANAG